MTDERLRDMERRWKQTGSVADEAAFLLERVRAGQLTQAQLELLAYAGDLAACAALQCDPGPDDPKDWVRGLLRFGGLGSRAACVAASCAASFRAGTSAPTERAQRGRAIAVAWINSPSNDLVKEAERLLAVKSPTWLDEGERGAVGLLHTVLEAARRNRRHGVDGARGAIDVTSSGHNPACPPDVLAQTIRADVLAWIRDGAYRFEARASSRRPGPSPPPGSP